MKKIFICLLVTVVALKVVAQDNKEEPHGFKQENIFLGGSLGLGFGSYTTNIGGTPEIGYSLAEWVDAGIAFNINYQSTKADSRLVYPGTSIQTISSFTYGAGPYVRIYPAKMLFLQAQLESDWIKNKNKDYSYGGVEYPVPTLRINALLVGVGYSQRIIGQSNVYTAILIDISKNANSPYINYGTAIPIVRAGFNFYLHPKRQK